MESKSAFGDMSRIRLCILTASDKVSKMASSILIMRKYGAPSFLCWRIIISYLRMEG